MKTLPSYEYWCLEHHCFYKKENEEDLRESNLRFLKQGEKAASELEDLD